MLRELTEKSDFFLGEGGTCMKKIFFWVGVGGEGGVNCLIDTNI